MPLWQAEMLIEEAKTPEQRKAEEAAQKAMQDPEIVKILQEPVPNT